MSTVPKPPPELDHPVWCARVNCAEYAEHRSAALQANVEPVESIHWYAIRPGEIPDPDDTAAEMLVVKARLTQFIGPPRPSTYISITGYDDSTGAWQEGLFAITLRQADLLADALTALRAMAAGGEAIQR